MNDSIFTKIIKGEIPAHKIYEDEDVLAFLDIEPKTEGHTLAIPKRDPAEFVWDLDNDIYAALMRVSKRLALHLREKTGKKFVHMAIVGTDVPYAHIHLVPFNETEELHHRTSVTQNQLAETAEKLRLDA